MGSGPVSHRQKHRHNRFSTRGCHVNKILQTSLSCPEQKLTGLSVPTPKTDCHKTKQNNANNITIIIMMNRHFPQLIFSTSPCPLFLILFRQRGRRPRQFPHLTSVFDLPSSNIAIPLPSSSVYPLPLLHRVLHPLPIV